MNAQSHRAYAATAHPDGARAARPRVVIGIATAGRPDILTETLLRIGAQARLPDAVIISVSDQAHLGQAPAHT